MLISVLFRLLNFAVVIAFITYLFKTSARASVVQAIADRQQTSDNLTHEWHRLQAHAVEVSRAVYEQQHQCAALKKKIDQWQQVHAQRVAHEQQQMLAIAQALASVHEFKREQTMQQRVMRAAGFQALQQAEQELIAQFASATSADRYVQDLLAHMQRGTHE